MRLIDGDLAEQFFRDTRSRLNSSEYKTLNEYVTRDLMLLNAEQSIHAMPTIQAVPIEVLQEIKQDIDEWYQFPHSSLNWLCYTKLCEIFDKHINNDQFERIWQNTVKEMKRRKICEDILEEAEEWDSETMSGSLLTDDDLRLLINDAIKEKKAEQDKVTKPLDDELQEIRQEIEKIPTTIKGIGYFNERDVFAYQIDVLKIIDTHISAWSGKEEGCV